MSVKTIYNRRIHLKVWKVMGGSYLPYRRIQYLLKTNPDLCRAIGRQPFVAQTRSVFSEPAHKPSSLASSSFALPTLPVTGHVPRRISSTVSVPPPEFSAAQGQIQVSDRGLLFGRAPGTRPGSREVPLVVSSDSAGSSPPFQGHEASPQSISSSTASISLLTGTGLQTTVLSVPITSASGSPDMSTQVTPVAGGLPSVVGAPSGVHPTAAPPPVPGPSTVPAGPPVQSLFAPGTADAPTTGLSGSVSADPFIPPIGNVFGDRSPEWVRDIRSVAQQERDRTRQETTDLIKEMISHQMDSFHREMEAFKASIPSGGAPGLVPDQPLFPPNPVDSPTPSEGQASPSPSVIITPVDLGLLDRGFTQSQAEIVSLCRSVERRIMEERGIQVVPPDPQVQDGDTLGRMRVKPDTSDNSFVPLAAEVDRAAKASFAGPGLASLATVAPRQSPLCRMDPQGWATITSSRDVDKLIQTQVAKTGKGTLQHRAGKKIFQLSEPKAQTNLDQSRQARRVAAHMVRLINGPMGALSAALLDLESLTGGQADPDMVKDTAKAVEEYISYAVTFLGDAIEVQIGVLDHFIREERRLFLRATGMTNDLVSQAVSLPIQPGSLDEQGKLAVPPLLGQAYAKLLEEDKDFRKFAESVSPTPPPKPRPKRKWGATVAPHAKAKQPPSKKKRKAPTGHQAAAVAAALPPVPQPDPQLYAAPDTRNVIMSHRGGRGRGNKGKKGRGRGKGQGV